MSQHAKQNVNVNNMLETVRLYFEWKQVFVMAFALLIAAVGIFLYDAYRHDPTTVTTAASLFVFGLFTPFVFYLATRK